MSEKSSLFTFKPAQLHTGKEWFVYYYVVNPATGKLDRKRIKLNRIKSVKERRKFANGLIHEINQKLYNGWNPYLEEHSPRGYTKLNDVLDTFYNSKSRQLRPDSLRSYRSFIKTFRTWMEKTDRMNMYSANFKKFDTIEFMDYIESKGMTNKTWNNYKTFFSNLFNWMIEHQYAAVNHFSELKKRSRQEKGRIIIDPETRELIKDHLKHKDYDFLIVCMLVFHALIRPKEIANLKPANFDLYNQTIMVSGTFSKNKKDRIATIPDALMTYLAAWNFNGANKDQYIFAEDFLPGTTPINARRFSKKWDRLRKDLDLPMEMKLYSLRDSGIVQMLNDGISPDEVMKQADHANLETTTTYAKHANPEGSAQIKSRNSSF